MLPGRIFARPGLPMIRSHHVVVLVALGLGGCKEYPTSSPSAPENACGAPVERGDVGRRIVEANCAWQERCGEIPAGGIHACTQIQAALGTDRTLTGLLGDPHLAYDAGEMACCVADTAAFPCAGSVHPASCSRAVRGTVPVGGACEEDFYCDGGECVDGVCVALPGPGEPCRNSCTEGHVCSWAGGDPRVCIPYAAEGETCDPWDRRCAAGLACDEASAGAEAEAVCRPPAEEGERCSDDVSCASADLYCAIDDLERSVGTCTRRADAGERCSYLRDESFGGCVVGLFCDSPGGGSTGTCTVLPGEGESCAELGKCAYPYGCFPGEQICVRFLYDGESCAGREHLCKHGECREGVCEWDWE
jgi:hypothetical protein